MKPTTPLYPGLLLALLVMVLYAIDVAKTHAGEPVADLRWPDLDGRTRALEEWQGRPVLLNYWASWCGPCIKEMPDLDAFASAQAEDGVQVIGIALDEAETVRAFLQRVPVGYPVLIEAVPGGESGSSGQFGNTHGVLPYSVLLDAQGRVVRTRLGPLSVEELASWAQASGS